MPSAHCLCMHLIKSLFFDDNVLGFALAQQVQVRARVSANHEQYFYCLHRLRIVVLHILVLCCSKNSSWKFIPVPLGIQKLWTDSHTWIKLDEYQ